MRTFAQNEPLTDAELDRLGDFLKSCKGGKAMNVEALDGFLRRPHRGTGDRDAERTLPGGLRR